jgi:hypothetical protein
MRLIYIYQIMSSFIANEIVKLREAKKDKMRELEACTKDYNDMVSILTCCDMKDRKNGVIMAAIKVMD